MLHGPRWKSSAAIYRDEGEEIEGWGCKDKGIQIYLRNVDGSGVTIFNVIISSGLPMATDHMQPKHQIFCHFVAHQRQMTVVGRPGGGTTM